VIICLEQYKFVAKRVNFCNDSRISPKVLKNLVTPCIYAIDSHSGNACTKHFVSGVWFILYHFEINAHTLTFCAITVASF